MTARKALARIGIAAVVSASVALAAPVARAGETCFAGFGGAVNYNIELGPAKFATVGTYAAPGVMFGKLSPCAGLSKWPLIGTLTVTTTSTVLAFRALTVDAAGCGATDNIVAMTPSSLSGTLQLHNDRNNGSNTGAFVREACKAPPPVVAPIAVAPGGQDPNGN